MPQIAAFGGIRRRPTESHAAVAVRAPDCFAPTRSGKGVGLVVPTLLTWPGSRIVHDIKGENRTLTSGFRAQHGRVLLFDPTNARSAAYNPLLEVRRGKLVRYPRDVFTWMQIALMLVGELRANSVSFSQALVVMVSWVVNNIMGNLRSRK